ncbi:MAG TPA: hypothetical protein VL172_22050 [Kofleriaceae bacterium]|jgi:hypothetical protein|nr:hypothetical protein [Kofleriaceae bacterium]
MTQNDPRKPDQDDEDDTTREPMKAPGKDEHTDDLPKRDPDHDDQIDVDDGPVQR